MVELIVVNVYLEIGLDLVVLEFKNVFFFFLSLLGLVKVFKEGEVNSFLFLY